MHHIFSLKAFTRMESSFIPFETLRNFLLETFSAFDSLPFFPSSKDSFDVNSLSFLFLELATNRSVSRLVVLQMATKIYRVKSRGGGGVKMIIRRKRDRITRILNLIYGGGTLPSNEGILSLLLRFSEGSSFESFSNPLCFVSTIREDL